MLRLAYAGPALSIPDNTSQGRRIVLTSTTAGQVKRLRVQLDIQHTYRGDLRVELVHAGRTLVLHNRVGGSADPSAGDFTLSVADLGRGDVGTIRSFAVSGVVE